MSRPDRVVLITSDRGYLVPSLVVALELVSRRHDPQDFDILILLLDISDFELIWLRDHFRILGILFEKMEQSLFSETQTLHFEASHVPKSAMARLSSPDYLSKDYKHVIYVDGDVQVLGDIYPLICFDVPDGRLLAGSDRYIISASSTGYSGAQWRLARDYLDKIEVTDAADYFNSGVMAAKASTWAEICQDALAFYKTSSHLCIYHDQSALNAVCRGRRDALSPRYNFITPFALAAGLQADQPAIVHFTGSDKPWLFPDRKPWGRYAAPYREILKRYPNLKSYAEGWFEGGGSPEVDRPRSTEILSSGSQALRTIQSRWRFRTYMRRQNFPFV